MKKLSKVVLVSFMLSTIFVGSSSKEVSAATTTKIYPSDCTGYRYQKLVKKHVRYDLYYHYAYYKSNVCKSKEKAVSQSVKHTKGYTGPTITVANSKSYTVSATANVSNIAAAYGASLGYSYSETVSSSYSFPIDARRASGKYAVYGVAEGYGFKVNRRTCGGRTGCSTYRTIDTAVRMKDGYMFLKKVG